MASDNEWYYSELLDFLKEKERKRDERFYQQIELELPMYEPQNNEEPIEKENRGILIIDFQPYLKLFYIIRRLVVITCKEMIKLNTENSAAIILAAQEIMDTGQLWVTLGDDEYYIPELIEQLQLLEANLETTKQ